MNKLSLKMKLGVGFGVLLAILLTMGVVNYFSVQKLTQLSATADATAEKELLAAEVGSLFNSQKAYIRGGSPHRQRAERNRLQESARKLTETMGKLEKTLSTEEGRRIFGKTQHAIGQITSVVQRGSELRSAGKVQEATDLIFGPEATAAQSEADQGVADFIEFQGRQRTAARSQQAASEASTVVWVVGLQ